ALQSELPLVLVEAENAESCDERVWATGAVFAVRRCSRGADEIHLRHQRAWRVLLAKKDHARNEVIEISRAERTRKAHLVSRVVAEADEVDVGCAVDLASRQEERIDTPLRGAIEQLEGA